MMGEYTEEDAEMFEDFFNFWDACSRLESAVYNLIENGIKRATIEKVFADAFVQYDKLAAMLEGDANGT